MSLIPSRLKPVLTWCRDEGSLACGTTWLTVIEQNIGPHRPRVLRLRAPADICTLAGAVECAINHPGTNTGGNFDFGNQTGYVWSSEDGNIIFEVSDNRHDTWMTALTTPTAADLLNWVHLTCGRDTSEPLGDDFGYTSIEPLPHGGVRVKLHPVITELTTCEATGLQGLLLQAAQGETGAVDTAWFGARFTATQDEVDDRHHALLTMTSPALPMSRVRLSRTSLVLLAAALDRHIEGGGR